MKPVVHPAFAGGTLGLGNLVGMVDGDVIDSTGMDVDLLSQILHAHGGALDVPAGIAPSPGRVPHQGLVLELALGEPQHKVLGIPLVLVNVDAGTGLQVIQIQAGQLSVVGEGGHVIVEVAAGQIGVAVGLKPLYQVDHVLDMLGGLAYNVGTADVEAVNVVEEGVGVELCDFQHRLPPLLGSLHHLVLPLVIITGKVANVGDVHDVGDVIVQIAEGLVQNVQEDVCPQVADMGVVVYGGSTPIKSCLACLEGDKILHFPSHGVI